MQSSEHGRFAGQLAEEVGRLIVGYTQKSDIGIRQKGVNDVVTDADYAAEQLIIQRVQQRFPSHKIFSEETRQDAHGPDDSVWFVDPIDGTGNYSIGLPLYGVSLGFMEKQVVTLGVAYFPALDLMFSAERGQGAYCNGVRLSVAENAANATPSLFFGAGLKPKTATSQQLERVATILSEVARIRSLGSMALEVCLCARSPQTASLFADFYPWDIAASALIAEEAGCVVTDLAGEPWSVNAKTCLAAPRPLHERLLSLLQSPA